ncbi:hypothetical protein C1Y08_22275 [Pseudomonas sp. FW306-02-F02-AA]|uniref:Uncharacterized protein n=1 Tax=Pseudomonas fluorescens TaxID=294 RepID=A0A0N9VQC3_PSEFL|nr:MULTISPECIES: hypothetical protein [Pseudomonas]ALI02315.1 hypothetical protein AO353_14945 [Pseudomonas fluorescens]PMZ02645.1 hypothetical protein C1Y07_18615 [Pseudomonas sp. FW306-02-F02-AB]PMZ08359.1 hypothetical protein C1Y06_19495 [Pseudomonas sp. FW306-02-H06C]PMZ13711.1 hypothetical protein C1Y08_22275 [Pseudomonas sp. FW306-02-F02-AA]PMZ22803.1 hypothetical protein C1Y09_06930 [Pseudomonas sp. FW306-02-F08-AA]
MQFLWLLFASRRKYRYFAQLDSNQCCLAFKHCRVPPEGDGWVEIEEIRLNWLHQPLPASARLSPRNAHARLHAV